MKQNTGFPQPSVSSVPFFYHVPTPNTIPQGMVPNITPQIMPQNVPQGMVPKVVGYLATSGTHPPQFVPINQATNTMQQSFHPMTNQTIIQSPIVHPPQPSTSTHNKKSMNELKDKHPCKHWEKCTKINYRDHPDHGEKYYHPCKLGSKCTSNDQVHKNRFVHPCKFGKSCKLHNEEHSLRYTHPCTSGTLCKKYLSGDIAHCFRFTHDANSDSNSNNNITTVQVSPWPKEWENPPKLSKNPLKDPHYKMVTLSTSSTEYQHVSKQFTNSSSGETILKIERIENYARWNWYSIQKQNMKSNHNEQLLFHGTKQEYAEKIAKEGFDARISNSGKFGNGIYFSPHANYSLSYAGRQGRIFLVRVLVGSSYSAQSMMQSTKIAPQGYDSVSGCQGQEIIVYDNKQAYPEYMITYQ